MPEIAPTFRRIERPNVRSDTSVQSFDCSLSSLAQESLQGMEHQLDGVKVRRILRQVTEACTNSPDRLLHTGNLMEGHVIDHRNVPTLERWGQTLLYVGQECFAIHGSFDQHGSHDAGLTQASDKRHRLPVAHGRVREQSLTARVPTVQAHHIGRDCRFVDEHEASSVKPALFANPTSACASHVSSLALCRPQAFFEGDAMASEEARKRAAVPGIRRLCSTETISFNVKSRCSRIRARICCEYFSNGEVLPPRGIGSQTPSSRKSCTQRIAELALTWNCSAASRRDPPPSTKRITRTLSSPGYGPRIAQPPANQCVRLAPSESFGNPDSLRLGRAVVQGNVRRLDHRLPLFEFELDERRSVGWRTAARFNRLLGHQLLTPSTL